MDNAMRQPVLVCAQNFNGVAVRVADMQDDRLFQFIRQIKLALKHGLLNLSRRKIVVIIQPDLPQRLHLFFLCQPTG